MRKFIREWREVVIWLPVAITIMLVSYWLFPKIDPRAGIDGFGDLFLYMVQMIKVLAVMFLAWIGQRTYFRDFKYEEERVLDANYLKGEGSQAFWLTVRNRLEYLSLLVILGLMLL